MGLDPKLSCGENSDGSHVVKIVFLLILKEPQLSSNFNATYCFKPRFHVKNKENVLPVRR
jgi:hypothetical protein